MCGIAGIVALNAAAASPSREALMRMVGALAHRGPDERGLYRDKRAGLAHGGAIKSSDCRDCPW